MLNVACVLISPIGDYGHDIFAMHPPHPFAHVPSDEVTNGTVSVGMSAFFCRAAGCSVLMQIGFLAAESNSVMHF